MSPYIKSFLIVSTLLLTTTCIHIEGRDQIHLGSTPLKILNSIEFIDSHRVVDNINLPQEINGVVIDWDKSSKPKYLSNFGSVKRPNLSTGDIKVTIQGSCLVGENWASKEFEFIIKSVGSNVEVFNIKGHSLSMIYIPTGSFILGDKKRVFMTDDFYIGEFEVSRGLYRSVMELEMDPVYDKFPITGITWEEAKEFCKRLNLISGIDFRLPTECEWEYAAAALSNSRYSGGEVISVLANYNSLTPTEYNNVDYKANGYGLYHMSGNVREWTLDSYGDYLKESENPVSLGREGDYISVRGGGFNSEEYQCSVVYRDYEHSGSKRDDLGIRLVFSY